MSETDLPLEGPAGPLEARLGAPEGAPRLGAVLAHPHPLYGGTMDNLVVRAAAAELRRLGAMTLRFNFRGVGASAGSHDEGRGEAKDLAAAEAKLTEVAGELPLWLVGYSFGAVMVVRRIANGDSRLEAATLLAPPIAHYDTSALESAAHPLGLVVGSGDDIAPAEAVVEASRAWPTTTHVEVLDPAGHDLGTMTGGSALTAALERTFGALAKATGLETPTGR